MKSRSKRNRKRSRGGIGCLVVGDSESEGNSGEDARLSSSLLRTEVVPLSAAFRVINGTAQDEKLSGAEDSDKRATSVRRVRIIHPYPYTFATFAKARWIGRTVADIYHEEFGSYPRSYYEAAINAGRILVSGKKVTCDYKVKGADELTHTVHRHEPAVGLADVISNVDNSGATANEKLDTFPPVQIVYEDDKLLVVDKPSTLPIHPCGGYNFNSLFEILSHWKPELYGSGKLFTVHRLDRLTSGLVIIAKSSDMSRSLGKCIMERDGCEKIYLARVRGKFPLGIHDADADISEKSGDEHPWKFEYVPQSTDCKHEGNEEETQLNKRQKCIIPVPCQHGEVVHSELGDWKGGLHIPIMEITSNKQSRKNSDSINDDSNTQTQAGFGHWFTDCQGSIVQDIPLENLTDQCNNMSVEEIITAAIGSEDDNHKNTTDQSVLWLNFACPCRIASHKNGVCDAGSFVNLTEEKDRKGIKPAQTAFTLLSYDASSDTSLVLAKPVTGRTHQIRLHLQNLGHPIANDHCYGGSMWYGDEDGMEIARKSREWLDKLDRGEEGGSNAPANSTNAETPATEAEIYHAAANRPREEGESILAFIEKTCVWCARCHGVEKMGDAQSREDNESAVFRRTLMEYFVRSQGIWLHALQYNLRTRDENGEHTMSHRTNLPTWA